MHPESGNPDLGFRKMDYPRACFLALARRNADSGNEIEFLFKKTSKYCTSSPKFSMGEKIAISLFFALNLVLGVRCI